MSFHLVFKEEARLDVIEITQWYDFKRTGLGDSFLIELDLVLDRIKHNPNEFQIKRKDIRHGILKRFPYLIIYRVEEKQIFIHSVIHSHRHPAKRYARLKKK